MRRGSASALLALLVLAAVAPATSAGGGTEVQWRETVLERVVEGRLAEGEERTLDLDVRFANLTRVEATLRWDDRDAPGVSRPDRFLLRVEGPRGLRAPPVEGDAGLLASSVRANPTPAATTLAEGDSLDRFVGHEGVGAWRVTVRLQSTGDPDGVRVDTGEDYNLVVHLHRYEAVPLRVVQLEEPATEPQVGGVPLWGGAAVALATVAAGLGTVLWRRR